MGKIKAVLLQHPTEYNNILLWAACCLAFFGFLRCGEFTVPAQSEYDLGAHLSIRDIAVDSKSSPTTIQVTIKQSKTDPFRQGVQLWEKPAPISVQCMQYYHIWQSGEPGLDPSLCLQTALT